MRGLFLVIVVALFLTGLDAAAHLFGYMPAPAQKQQEHMAAMDCCPKSHDGGKQADLKCHYCCAAVIGMTDVPHLRFVAPRVTIAKQLVKALPRGPAYGLFRPPKNLLTAA